MKSFKLNYFANGSKKAKTTNRNFQLKDVVADEDYILFLNCYCVDSDNDFNSGSDDDSDPQYSMFLENLSENGNSYVLKVARDNKICHIEYEEEDKSCDEIKRNCRRRVTWRSDSMREKTQSPVKLQKTENPIALRSKEGKSLAVEMNGDRQPVFGGTMACSNRRSGSADTHLAKHESQCQMKCDITVDQSYEVFLNFVEKGGCSMMFKGEESGSDSEIMVMDSDPYCNETTPFVPSRVFDSSCFSDEKILGKKKWCFSGNHSQFRKRLIELLERPYDQKEYESLWQEVSRRRQKEGGKESRRGRRTYPIDAVGRSYLDLHTDLGEKIDQFSECNKRLFLLRGFFFWLQNKVHDGAFQPWLDSSCLKMLCDM
ncbi:polyprotein [Quillaja saponaria]|uniref:Polyprotein n=1 Tax=Quillaja saponaria TaxID=32244 RepID=A0AAD7LWH6_QUISA|nr:polyprotein [Quillaja saponaria]